MKKFILSCCSTADLTQEHFDRRDIKYICFSYSLNGVTYKDDLGKSVPFDKFYKAMAEGAQTKTSQVNTDEYIAYFTPMLEAGHDVLHICFSSGLSGSYNSARLAKEDLSSKFPDRKLYIVDSLCASSGYGLFMDKLADLRDGIIDCNSTSDGFLGDSSIDFYYEKNGEKNSLDTNAKDNLSDLYGGASSNDSCKMSCGSASCDSNYSGGNSHDTNNSGSGGDPQPHIGMDIDTLYNWASDNCLRLHHLFFSTDLSSYVKGGRVSKTAGFVGNLLNICPILNMSNEGKLVLRTKAMGKKKAARKLVERMEQLADGGLCYNQKCYICHSACLDEAKALAALVADRFPRIDGDIQIYSIGTTVGSHTGGGTIALFFWGEKRND